MNVGMGKYTQAQIITSVATLMGAFGGFPDPPRVFKVLTKNEFAQWAMVFILLYQGGAGQDVELAAMITVGAFVVYKLLKYQERMQV